MPVMARRRREHWRPSSPWQDALRGGLERQALQAQMRAGAARNALDCALWDLEAKVAEKRIWDLLGRPAPRPLTTAYTISLARLRAWRRPPQRRPIARCQDQARRRRRRGPGSPPCRKAAPDAELIVDANEAWTDGNLERHLAACAAARGDHDRATPARRARSGAFPYQAARSCLRRRKRARPRVAGRTAGALRRHQHQTRQDRRSHRGAGDG